MAGVSEFACVQHYGFHSSFLIVFFPYTEDYLRSQHLVVSPTVCSTHCSSATNVHINLAPGDYEVYHMPVVRAGMRPGGIVCILLFEHGVRNYQIESVHSANRSSPLKLHFPIP